jgi:hypothetical protein
MSPSAFIASMAQRTSGKVSCVRPPQDVLETLDAVALLGKGGVVDEVLRRELVEEVQPVLVVTILYHPPDDRLVLFREHVAPSTSLMRRPHHIGRSSTSPKRVISAAFPTNL